VLPCLLFEDDHLLVVNKPPGLNTHAPSPYAGEGLYEWLRGREPRWASLAIIHRLDKETSGALVFSKTKEANRSLTAQFTNREVSKKYVLLAERRPRRSQFTATSSLVRAGEKYVSRANHPDALVAETRFRVVGPGERAAREEGLRGSLPGVISSAAETTLIEAEPLTGRTHQIRVHAAEHGFPVLGDILYGGSPAPRVFLHAEELAFSHPVTGEPLRFSAPADFTANPRQQLRAALIDPVEIDSFRIVNGASDGWPGWYVDKLGGFVLSQSDQPLNVQQKTEATQLIRGSARAVYHKTLRREPGRSIEETSPELVIGKPSPARFHILENGIQFELSFNEGYSVGLFLDQRDNRRRHLTGYIAPDWFLSPPPGSGKLEVLNTFAYTCGFSVCAAKAGARTTSIDLSKKYLDWGRRNFELNHLDPAGHDFIYGDVFDWMRRLARKGRLFDVILLDPPTFSQSKASGIFRAEKDYGKLVTAALPLLKAKGVLFASTNAAEWKPEEFMKTVQQAIRAANRQLLKHYYVPQPPDFPISRPEPVYLKTAWFSVG